MSVTNATSLVFQKPTCDRANLPVTDMFTPTHVDGKAGLITPGDEMFLASNATGRYCRTMQLDGGCMGLVCDLDSPTGPPAATKLAYTG
jgi:hypothetical protein